MWEMHDGMGWWMIFAAIWMVLFWAIVIGGIAWIVVNATRHEKARGPAVEAARQRYARGDISADEFHRLMSDLQPDH